MSPTVVQLATPCPQGGEPRYYVDSATSSVLRIDIRITLLAAGLIFLLALVLGVWKYRQIMVAEDHRAHPYVDIAHRAALLYSFATLLIAVFVEFSAWPAWVNLTAAMVVVFFFVAAIASYISHGARRDTTNQFEKPDRGLRAMMTLLIAGEIGGFGVILAGFIVGQLL
ncbi:MAG TPA: hypothetical protein VE441_12415 [Mycobacterium sp.]|nr:hypothetical protein [Mycobacterium sp.]